MSTGVVWTVMPRGRRPDPDGSGDWLLDFTLAAGFVDVEAPGASAAGSTNGTAVKASDDEPTLKEQVLSRWPAFLQENLHHVHFEFDLDIDSERPSASFMATGYVIADQAGGFTATKQPAKPILDDPSPPCRPYVPEALNEKLWRSLFARTYALWLSKDKQWVRLTSPVLPPGAVLGYDADLVASGMEQDYTRRALLASEHGDLGPTHSLEKRSRRLAARLQAIEDVTEVGTLLQKKRPEFDEAEVSAFRAAKNESCGRQQGQVLPKSDPVQVRRDRLLRGEDAGRGVDGREAIVARERERAVGTHGEPSPYLDRHIREKNAARGDHVRPEPNQAGVRHYGPDPDAMFDRETRIGTASGRAAVVPQKPDLTLAQGVSQVRDFVTLLRPLGLALDVTVRLPAARYAEVRANLEAGVRIRADPRWRSAQPSPGADALPSLATWSAVQGPAGDEQRRLHMVPGGESGGGSVMRHGRLLLGKAGFSIRTLDFEAMSDDLMQESVRRSTRPEPRAVIDDAGFVVASNLEMRGLIERLLDSSNKDEEDWVPTSHGVAPDYVQPGVHFPSYFETLRNPVPFDPDAYVEPSVPTSAEFSWRLRQFVHGSRRFERRVRFEIAVPKRKKPIAVMLEKLAPGPAPGSLLIRVALAPTIEELPERIESAGRAREVAEAAPARTSGVCLIWRGRAQLAEKLKKKTSKLWDEIRAALVAKESPDIVLHAEHAVLGYKPEIREPSIAWKSEARQEHPDAAKRWPKLKSPPYKDSLGPAVRHEGPPDRTQDSLWHSLVERIEHWHGKPWGKDAGQPFLRRGIGLVQPLLAQPLDVAGTEAGRADAVAPSEQYASDVLFNFFGHSLGVPMRPEGVPERQRGMSGSVDLGGSTPDPVPMSLVRDRPIRMLSGSLPRLTFEGIEGDPSPDQYSARVSIVDLAGNVLDHRARTLPNESRSFRFQRHEPLMPPTVVHESDKLEGKAAEATCHDALQMVVHAEQPVECRRLIAPSVERQHVAWHSMRQLLLLNKHGGSAQFELSETGDGSLRSIPVRRHSHRDRCLVTRDAEAGAEPGNTNGVAQSDEISIPVYSQRTNPSRRPGGWQYVTDPMVREYVVRLLPDFPDPGQPEKHLRVTVPVYAANQINRTSRWPHCLPIRLKVKTLKARKDGVALRPILKPNPVWDPRQQPSKEKEEANVILWLPPGWSGRLEIGSTCLEGRGRKKDREGRSLFFRHGFRRQVALTSAARSPEAKSITAWAKAVQDLEKAVHEYLRNPKGPWRDQLAETIKELDRLAEDYVKASTGAAGPATSVPAPVLVTPALRARVSRTIPDGSVPSRHLNSDLLSAISDATLVAGLDLLRSRVRDAVVRVGPGSGAAVRSQDEADPLQVIDELLAQRRSRGLAVGDGAVAKAMVQELEEGWGRAMPSGSSRSEQAALQGRNAVFAPRTTVRVAHAVKRPAMTPVLRAKPVIAAEPSRTHGVEVDLTFDPRSTSVIEILASWTDLEDTSGALAAENRTKEASVHRVDVDALPYAQDGRIRFVLQHELPDPRAREVSYKAVAYSRYADFFFGSVEAPDAAKSSNTVPLQFPSSVAPETPVVERVAPVFSWEEDSKAHESKKDGKFITEFKSTRSGNMLRVRVSRPWFTTGNGEQLGVVLLPAAASLENVAAVNAVGLDMLEARREGKEPEPYTPPSSEHAHPSSALRGVVSVWGADPIGGQGQIDAALHLGDLREMASARLVPAKFIAPAVAELPGIPERLLVVGFPIREDVSDGTWFADVPLGRVPAYGTFVRLMVVRMQPSTLAPPQARRPNAGGSDNGSEAAARETRAHFGVSEGVTVPPVQVWPDRQLILERDSAARTEAAVGTPESEEALVVRLRRDATVAREPLEFRKETREGWLALLTPEARDAEGGSGKAWRPRSQFECLVLAMASDFDGGQSGWVEIARAVDRPSVGDEGVAAAPSAHPDVCLKTVLRGADDLARWHLSVRGSQTIGLRLLVREWEVFPARITPSDPDLPSRRMVYSHVLEV